MKTLFTLFGLLSFSTIYCQDKCSAIIDWKYLKTINIYDKPDGKVTQLMKNDSINEDFLHLDILNQTETYFFVSISRSIKSDSATGWIKKGEYIGAYKKHEKFPMDLVLYKDKNLSEIDRIVIANWQPEILTIETCSGEWTFISLKQNGKTFKGWILTDELCANTYSYCN